MPMYRILCSLSRCSVMHIYLLHLSGVQLITIALYSILGVFIIRLLNFSYVLSLCAVFLKSLYLCGLCLLTLVQPLSERRIFVLSVGGGLSCPNLTRCHKPLGHPARSNSQAMAWDKSDRMLKGNCLEIVGVLFRIIA